MENWGKRRDITGRGHCFRGSPCFKWDMATDTGTYQGGIIGRYIRLPPFLVAMANGMLWGRTPMR